MPDIPEKDLDWYELKRNPDLDIPRERDDFKQLPAKEPARAK